jgi:hypothetical protein
MAGEAAVSGVEPALPVRKLRPLRALLPYLSRYRRQVALALLFLLLAAGATLALPLSGQAAGGRGTGAVAGRWRTG